MKVLVIGSGGREHTLVWKLSQSPLVTEIFCAPGNPGIANLAKCVDIEVENIEKLVEFSREMKIEFAIVGPEAPLVLGIVDAFRKVGIKIIGPSKHAARLEGSKSFSKDFMMKYGISTAKYNEVDNYDEAIKVLENYSYPVVIKADGLASGKGVLICENREEAINGLTDILKTKVFGSAGDKVVIEEFLEGIETSILCFVDGKTIVPMVSCQDHKRIFDGDKGPNTGGMGTYSPNYVYTEEISKIVDEDILKPTLKGIQEENMDYRGILFIGLMITKECPKVLEYNCRFGDPETQVVLPRLDSDLVEIFLAMLDYKLSEMNIKWNDKAAVCVVLASGGYPGDYEKGIPIYGLENKIDNAIVFHSGTKMLDGEIVTNGGRVLGVTAWGDDIETARKNAYYNVEKINFVGKTYRTDIATR
ncbi:phosphoribosylamine--glycine ligase [Serpentinicella alkaliphila]|uniref:Phosphoribosylamine--glycine ligase n=1 Tax=Serpentinicella alkaliphila TaxID=1734049 RepID=A0A4R2U099_9FIRM|nr:phosphoribosylamine--glycine ligase [Serpentinicella alkaliphila]QUH24842.1 phosphoribosylamine--glycine ligase [Serpentinicella alkaliphila]TCQ03449.1 phosphoribosylamine--glycine ligase [Serpentinicella alkaliphila]